MAKNQFIRARVAGWEKDCIRRKADAAHMTESEFVRRAAMSRSLKVWMSSCGSCAIREIT